MEQQMHEIVQEVFSDLQATCDVLDAETLADTIGDRMFDYSEEYRNTEYVKRRALVLKVAKQYV